MATLKTGRLAGIRLLLNRVGRAIDTIRENERIRFELLSIVTGVWDYIKNSGKSKGLHKLRTTGAAGLDSGRRDIHSAP